MTDHDTAITRINSHDTAMVLTEGALQELQEYAWVRSPFGHETIVVIPREDARERAAGVENTLRRPAETRPQDPPSILEQVALLLGFSALGAGLVALVVTFTRITLTGDWVIPLLQGGLVIAAAAVLYWVASRAFGQYEARTAVHKAAQQEAGELLEQLRGDAAPASWQLASLHVACRHAQDLAEQITPQVHQQMLQHPEHAQEALQALHRQQLHAEREREQQVVNDILTAAETSREG